ncbi:hypothetical protein D3C71_1660510 [compost metagenome]
MTTNIILNRVLSVVVKDQNMILFHARLQTLPERGASVWEITVSIQKVSDSVVQPVPAGILLGVNQAIQTISRMLNNRRQRIQIPIYRTFGYFIFLHQIAAVNDAV